MTPEIKQYTLSDNLSDPLSKYSEKMVSRVGKTYWIFIIVVVFITFQSRIVCEDGEASTQQMLSENKYANETGKYANEDSTDAVEQIMESISEIIPDQMQYRNTEDHRYRDHRGSIGITKPYE